MLDTAALQRQYDAVHSVGGELRQSLDRIESEYRAKLDEVSGRRAPVILDIGGTTPLIHGLEWAVREESWAVIVNSKRLVEIMEQLATDVTQGLPLDAFSKVPQESWDKYIALCDQYAEQREVWRTTLRQIEKVWADEVRPHLDATRHHSD